MDRVFLIPWVSLCFVSPLFLVISGCGGQHSGVIHTELEMASLPFQNAQGLEVRRGELRLGQVREPIANGDRYDVIRENQFVHTAHQPLSTFSIDVDTASFSKVRQYLLDDGRLPRPDAVRLEELINYFPYAYQAPLPGTHEVFANHIDLTWCPWEPQHKLMRIALKGREIDWQEKPPSQLVLLIDTSGSMQAENRLPLLKQAIRMLVSRLDGDDRIAIVAYAGSAGVVLDSTPGDQPREIMRAIESLKPYGSTNGGAGIELAYRLARDHRIEGGVNRVLLCTDGDFNVGMRSNDQLVDYVKQEAREGVELSVLGFGMGNHNDAMLEQITGIGNGNYAFIDSAAEARKVLVEQLTGTLVTIAHDVKIQVEFNPEKVSAYRLLGYENRMLEAPDFRDDRVDAGELGAGHTVTAIYEVVPVGVSTIHDDRPVDPLKYSAAKVAIGTDASSAELATIKLRYKLPGEVASVSSEQIAYDSDTAFVDMDEDFRFAASVAAFGMLLRGSRYAGDWELGDVKRVALASTGQDITGVRGQFLELIDQATKLRGGKKGMD